MVMTIVGAFLAAAVTAILFCSVYSALTRRKETRMPDEKKEPRRFQITVYGSGFNRGEDGGGDVDTLSLSAMRELFDKLRAEMDHRGYIRRVAGEKTDG